MVSTIPRPEHPRPQFERADWLNLNGLWQFEVDRGDTGFERGLLGRELRDEIKVPFAPESTASGIGDVDFLTAVWYRRTVTVPEDWAGRRLLLHFGAVDHDATVWVDGTEVARHRGGFTSFTADLGPREPGAGLTIVVRARDTRDEPQARGKQATWFENTACFYTRTTGIWQTVWLEPVPEASIGSVSIVPQRADSSFAVTAELSHRSAGMTFEAVLSDAQGAVVTERIAADDLGPRLTLRIPENRVRLWSPTDPHLYDLTLRLLDGSHVVDEVKSYAGLRSVAIDGHRILLNGEPVFQRLVLDQGYWPDTLMTAPSDDALRRDIELGMAAGFNGARLHQKVFEERYFYHADRLGYLVWAEFGDWGAGGAGGQGSNQQPTASFISQWIEAVQRDRSHPSIIGWCPLNETYQVLHDRITQLDDVTAGMYLATKAVDPTRPVIDASGYSHRVRGADVYDSHSYEQDPEAFRAQQAGLADGAPHVNDFDGAVISLPYAGQPYFVSEYGGIWWNERELAHEQASADDPARAVSWGYGERVASVEQWHARFRGLTEVLLQNPLMFGYCYTQLTDTFQEENGLYDFERRPKFDVDRICAVQKQAAAYELEGRS
ncbi:sugar-binding domain-containing protein [Rathayibacter sp. VKM Ac-2760]|uniref:glycoside hydrolase family 2 protein n=1 Tax=Rathayibacter sp. VKM Ac-2760 TaxID=2609253 RepID=UPI001315C874|nr:sugar-binding domain-containing protein [Rathayibacter sp. VKM Ac-2760]QHC61169.1 beta-galactosidase [Rathayibacter sp. VKM Ac-2760]